MYALWFGQETKEHVSEKEPLYNVLLALVKKIKIFLSFHELPMKHAFHICFEFYSVNVSRCWKNFPFSHLQLTFNMKCTVLQIYEATEGKELYHVDGVIISSVLGLLGLFISNQSASHTTGSAGFTLHSWANPSSKVGLTLSAK